MRKAAIAVLALSLFAQSASGQQSPFRSLLGGAITYRPTLAWEIVKTYSEATSEGVLLRARAPEDSALYAVLMVYPEARHRTFQEATDSSLGILSPDPSAKRLAEKMTDSSRSVLWTTETSSGPVLSSDRIVRVPTGYLYTRITMPATPPRSPDLLPERIEVINDFLTSIHLDGRLLFPHGSEVSYRLY